MGPKGLNLLPLSRTWLLTHSADWCHLFDDWRTQQLCSPWPSAKTHTHVAFVIKQAADTQTHVCFKISMVGQKQCVFTHLLNKQYSQIHVSMCMCVHVCVRGLQSCCWLTGGGVWRRGRRRFRPRHLNLCKMNKKMYDCFRSSGLSFLSMRGVDRLTSVCAAWAAGFSAPAGGGWGTGFLQHAAGWQTGFAHASPCFGEIWTVDHVQEGQKQSYRFLPQEEWQQPEADWCTGLKGAFVRLFTPLDAQTRNPKLNMNFNQIEIWNPNESTTINLTKTKCSNYLITITLISFPNCFDWNVLWCRRLAQNYCL